MLWPVLKRSSLGGIGDQHPLLFAQHVIHDGPAHSESSPHAARPSRQRTALGSRQRRSSVLPQHDAAAVRLDGAKDQLQDAVEKLVKIEDVADGLAGLVHDRQVGQGGLEPGSTPVRAGPGCGCLRSRRSS